MKLALVIFAVSSMLFPFDALARTPKLLIVGDSITNEGFSYARQLSRVYVTEIIAKDGVQTGWMLRHLRAAKLKKFTHLIVLGGVNDINCGNLSRAGTNLLEMYSLGKAAKLKVIAVTVSPWMGWHSWTETKHAQTFALNWWIREWASGFIDGVADFYGIVRDPTDERALAGPYGVGTDHLHPNWAAHHELYRLLLRLIR